MSSQWKSTNHRAAKKRLTLMCSTSGDDNNKTKKKGHEGEKQSGE